MRIQRTSIRFRTYRAARKAMSEAYPAAFPCRGRRPPLKVGIHRDIIAADTRGLSATQVRTFLQVWTSSCAYLCSMSRGGERIALDGTPAGPIQPEAAAEATKRIESRRRTRRGT